MSPAKKAPTKKKPAKSAPRKSAPTTSAKAKRTMSDDHKAAIAVGRVQNKAVADYLDGLEATKRGPGRRRTPESITAQLAATDASLATATGIQKLELLQKRIGLTNDLASFDNQDVDIEALQAAFIEHAAGYSQRKNISPKAWRQAGVTAATLKAAGIK